jgi:hypothetical protein
VFGALDVRNVKVLLANSFVDDEKTQIESACQPAPPETRGAIPKIGEGGLKQLHFVEP